MFHGFFLNPENFAYLKMSSKQRQNKVGSRHSSALLLDRACGEDAVSSVKLGVKLGQASHEFIGDTLAVNASTEFMTGGSLSLLKSKFFLRRIIPFKDAEYELQTNLSGGIIHNLNQTPLRVNDAFYL